MKNLLQIISLSDYPIILSDTYIQEAVSSDLYQYLKAHDIITYAKPSNYAYCELCQETHEVTSLEKKEPMIYCAKNGELIPVSMNELINWQFNIVSFLKCICKNLGIQEDIQGIDTSPLWKAGTYKKEKLTATVYFSRTDLEELKDTDFTHPHPYAIILHAGKGRENTEDTVFVNLSDIINDDHKTIFDKELFKGYIIKTIRPVTFTAKGELQLHSHNLAYFSSDTPQYYFLEYLNTHFGVFISHEEVHRYTEQKYKELRRKKTWAYEDDPEKFCYRMKNDIKGKVNSIKNSQIIEDIIQHGRIEGDILAVRLTSPSVNP